MVPPIAYRKLLGCLPTPYRMLELLVFMILIEQASHASSHPRGLAKRGPRRASAQLGSDAFSLPPIGRLSWLCVFSGLFLLRETVAPRPKGFRRFPVPPIVLLFVVAANKKQQRPLSVERVPPPPGSCACDGTLGRRPASLARGGPGPGKEAGGGSRCDRYRMGPPRPRLSVAPFIVVRS